MPKSSTTHFSSSFAANALREALRLSCRALGGSRGALLKRCQARFQACLRACRHAWARASTAPGPVAGSNKSLRGIWTGEDGLVAGTSTVRLLL
eukprot:4692001-Pyramimonas_sp.AAC.1